MFSNQGNDLNFIGSQQQQSESVHRSSYGAGGLQGSGNQLNPQNLGGLGGGAQRYGGMVNSEIGSIYRGGEDDALSHYMGQSEFAPTEVGIYPGQSSLRPPAANAAPAKRRSEFKQDKKESLPPRGREQPKKPENKNYGSFLQGLGGDKNPRARSEYRKEGNNMDINGSVGRDRSSRRRGEGDESASNIDVISLGSRRQAGYANYSPNKDQMSQGEDNSYLHGTPQIGNQIFIQDMNI